MVHGVLWENQTESVDTEVCNLLCKQAIEACDHEVGEYISPIFTWPKKDGSRRMILLTIISRWIQCYLLFN